MAEIYLVNGIADVQRDAVVFLADVKWTYDRRVKGKTEVRSMPDSPDPRKILEKDVLDIGKMRNVLVTNSVTYSGVRHL
jgi:hypothetical protein